MAGSDPGGEQQELSAQCVSGHRSRLPSAGSVIEALQTGSFDTVMGKIGFDDKGDITGVDNFIWYVFEEDKYIPAR